MLGPALETWVRQVGSEDFMSPVFPGGAVSSCRVIQYRDSSGGPSLGVKDEISEIGGHRGLAKRYQPSYFVLTAAL